MTKFEAYHDLVADEEMDRLAGVFREAWHEADDAGWIGGRVIHGLAAVFGSLGIDLTEVEYLTVAPDYGRCPRLDQNGIACRLYLNHSGVCETELPGFGQPDRSPIAQRLNPQTVRIDLE